MYVDSQRTVKELKEHCHELESILSSLQAEASHLTKKYTELRRMILTVNLAIDYGNGTIIWYNGTIVPNGSTLLSLTVLLAKVEYKLYPMGAYITSINDVSEKIITPGKEGYSWLWYIYDEEKNTWVAGLTSADSYLLRDGDTVMWKYTHWKF